MQHHCACVVLVVLALSLACHAAPTLRFKKDGTFKILQLTDMHFGEDEDNGYGSIQDNNSIIVMNAVIAYEKPDLIVFTGDLITGNNIIDNATTYWKEALGPAIAAGIPWMITFGNHDDLASGVNGTRKDLMSFDMSFPLSLSRMGPTDIHGVSNYVVPILSSASDAPATYIYILDSEDQCTQGGSGWGCVWPDQVQWYVQQSQQLQQKSFPKIVPALSFFHIPLQEHLQMWNAKTCYGYNNDSVACQSENTGLYSAFVKMGDVKFASVGHNHQNDFCGEYDGGITLCFGRHSGYGGYGSMEFQRGARVIQLTENPFSISTWLRLMLGDVVNSTDIPHTPRPPFQTNC